MPLSDALPSSRPLSPFFFSRFIFPSLLKLIEIFTTFLFLLLLFFLFYCIAVADICYNTSVVGVVIVTFDDMKIRLQRVE